MILRELFEAPGKTAVAAFGRMNPPTIGHAKLVDKIKSIDGDHYLFLSQTQKPKDNPLEFSTKLSFAKKFFPGVNVGHEKVRTPIQMLQMLEQLGYTDIVYVAGSDRVAQFEKLFNDYNGKEYNFNSIQVVSAGERDPDAEGAEGMSASKMRAAAKQGDFESFKQGVPDQGSAEKMYDAVRAGMGVKDDVPTENIVEFDVKSSKGYEQLEDYAGREIYRSRKKFKEKYFIAQAVHPRTRAVVAKVSDENRKTAEQKLHAELDKVNTERKRVTGNATVDFNVEFAKQILSEPGETFYAKIISGPKLVIAGSEMLEYPEIMQDEGFKRSAIRNRKDAEGSTRLPAIPLSARQAGEANVVANGRYVVGNQSTDKDGNLVFDLEFDSEVYDKNDRVRIRQPALTIGTNRNEDMQEASSNFVGGISTRILKAYLKKLLQQELDPYEETMINKIRKELKSRGEVATESDVVLNKTSLREYIKDLIIDKLNATDDVDQLAEWLQMIVNKTVKSSGGSKFTVTDEDVMLALEGCEHGMYYCSDAGKMKCRKGPKKSRG